MGTMVGDDGAGNQVGVAPGAKWIAAKGCESNSCSDASLLAAGQWVLAPTDLNGAEPPPRPAPRHRQQLLGRRRRRPLVPADRRGLAGRRHLPGLLHRQRRPGLRHRRLPRRQPQRYAVGSYDVNNAIAGFSGRGNATDPAGLKPNIAAPGSNVRSSVPGNGYAAFSGTSMAAPHVAGTVALVWSAAPSLRGDVAATETLLDRTATRRRRDHLRGHRRRQQRLRRGAARRVRGGAARPRAGRSAGSAARSPTRRTATRSPVPPSPTATAASPPARTAGTR